MQVPAKFRSFDEFWPYYLAEHSRPSTRRWHFMGSALSLGCLTLLVSTGRIFYLPAGMGLGYGCAWIGHLLFERNRPTTFKYPLYSLAGDWKMFFLTLTGRLDAELNTIEARTVATEETNTP